VFVNGGEYMMLHRNNNIDRERKVLLNQNQQIDRKCVFFLSLSLYLLGNKFHLSRRIIFNLLHLNN
jgi:hypothetical protein